MAWVKRELDSLGIPPLKRLGQHFLVDTIVRERLIELADLKPADVVLEVGPGLGFLTSALLARAQSIIAVEKDRTLANYLKRKFSGQERVTIIEGDALTAKIPDGAKIVSSPPYNISSKLVLLIMQSRFQLATLILQEEFARRLTATSGSRDYGRMSVMLQSRAQAQLHSRVPPEAFHPKPRVNSALVTIRPSTEPILLKNRELFIDLVRGLFTQRRRMMRGVLTRYLRSQFPRDYTTILRRVQVYDKRVYELKPNELADLANSLDGAISEL
jgi:16S rRNA (adenine1518-N6/adenine1519-N6)-dimethyltransferase